METKFGFGCMRLPMNGDEVDYAEFNRMIDYYMDAGFNYFDTAHGYLDGKSETAIRDCLAARYPRDSYILTDKLTDTYFKSEADIRPFFESQLAATGVEYFDYYLMHSQTAETYEYFMARNAYEVVKSLKAESRVRHIGISFHDKASVLDKILSEHPEIEVVQIQFNYADFNSPSVESRKVYETCHHYNKPVLVMEPVKGGALVRLPEKAKEIFAAIDENASPASFAIRFAASFDGMFKVLSGMSDMEQMKDNVATMRDFKPFTPAEYEAVDKVCAILGELGGIACTACRYCTAGCPQHILIPDLFGCYNAKKQFNDWNSNFYYGLHTRENGKASDCIGCRQCERICPQHLPITSLLKEVAAMFETGEQAE